MNSVPLALTWECWSRSRTAPLLALGICVSLVSFYAFWPIKENLVDFESAHRYRDGLATIHALLFMTVMPIVVVYVEGLVGGPETRFTLPISTWSLVGWPMFNGCIATACGYLFLAAFANTFFDAQWPLLKPLFAAALIFALSHALSWIPECGRLRPLIAILGSALLVTATFGLHQFTVDQALEPYWQAFTGGKLLLTLALIGAAYVAAVSGERCELGAARSTNITHQARRVLH